MEKELIIILFICIMVPILLILIGLKLKNRKTLLIGKISFLIILTIIIFGGIYIYNDALDRSLNKNTGEIERTKVFEDPDRIIYKKDDKYYQFTKGEEKYNEILNEINQRIYSSFDGVVLSEEKIDKIQEEDYIEFDYNQISKNNIIPLEEDNIGMIKRFDEGGQIINNNLQNKKELENKLEKIIKDEKEYTMNQEDYLSKNKIDNISQNNISELTYKKEDTYTKIIQNEEEYNKFITEYNVNIDKQINKDILENNNIIALITPYEIEDIKCKIGSITYNLKGEKDYNIVQENIEYNVNILIVSKIINEKCIYINTENIKLINSSNISGEINTYTEESSIIQNINNDNIEVGYNKDILTSTIKVTENTKIIDYITGNTLQLSDLKQGDCAYIKGNEIEKINDMKKIEAQEIQIYKKEYAISKIQNRYKEKTIIDEGGGIEYKNIDNNGNGYIIYEVYLDEGNRFNYYLKLQVTNSTETYLGWGTHIQSNYGYIEHEMAKITLDNPITDIENINSKVIMIEYIAD